MEMLLHHSDKVRLFSDGVRQAHMGTSFKKVLMSH